MATVVEIQIVSYDPDKHVFFPFFSIWVYIL